ncbi:hypothetical protein FGE12_14400 [Aggregicoccus sp. 17bor-14]|uniref:hypothetical protein n=1 Tax=Myxococcaceae TaxID=31 RepID=UPI00129C861C|nr:MULTISPECIES: hypothetical protein [Myxococcaceae]MBF5043584.1 hypothetical protein [Simulacricoccus sp. 17bor-14]MRI89343.1 hypothetical protein [Aggregicoccus sp. 17bor-14]
MVRAALAVAAAVAVLGGCGGAPQSAGWEQPPEAPPAAPAETPPDTTPASTPKPASEWLITVPGAEHTDFFAAAAPDGGAVAELRSILGSESKASVRRYDPEGALAWSLDLPAREDGSDAPAVTASGEALVWPQSGARIHRVSPRGELVASLSLPRLVSIWRDGVVASPLGTALVLPEFSTASLLGQVIDAQGHVVQELQGSSGSSIRAGAFDERGNAVLYVERGPVRLGARQLVGTGRHLLKLSPSGELLWSTPVLPEAEIVDVVRLVLDGSGGVYLLGSLHGRAHWGSSELTYEQMGPTGQSVVAAFALAATAAGAPRWAQFVPAYGRIAAGLPGGGLALLRGTACGGSHLLVLDASGNLQAEQPLADARCGAEPGNVNPSSLAATSDGALLVAGSYSGVVYFGTRRVESPAVGGWPMSDAFLMKVVVGKHD